MDTPPRNIHPHYAFDLNSQLIDELLFESLITLDKQHVPTCTILCEAFHFENKTNLVFELSTALLKGKVRFSDNTAITPKDIIASINALKDPKSPFKGAFNIIQDVQFKSPNLLVLRLTTPKPSLLIDLFLAKIFKQHQAVFPSVPIDQLITSGPYQLASKHENQIVLKSNAYWHSEQKSPLLHLFFIRDDQTRVFKFIRDEVDVIFNATPLHSVKEMKEKYHATILSTPGINITYLGLNQNHPILKDSNVRRLIYESLNIEELLHFKLHGFAQEHFSLLPIGSPFIDASKLKTYAQKRLTNSQKQNILSKLSKQSLEIKSSNSPTAISMVHAIKAQLTKTGIQIKHRPLEFGAFMADLKSGNFDLYYARFVGITDPSAYYDFLHADFIPPKGRNRIRYNDPAWNKLSKKLSTETDFEARVTLSHQLQEKFAQQLPMIPLWVADNIVVLKPNFKLSKISSRQSLRDFLTLERL